MTEDLEKQVKSLQKQLEMAEQSNFSMQEAFLNSLNQLKEENHSLHSQLADSFADRDTLQKEVTAMTKYMTSLEERVYSANQTALDLLKNVRDLELENATLKNYCIDLKARVAVYVPMKDDPVD